MRSKIHNVYLLTLCTIIFSLLTGYSFYLFNNTNTRITILNERIDALNASITADEETIQYLKEQITVNTYNIEHTELKDTSEPVIQEVKKVSAPKQPEKYKQSDLKLLAKLIESESGNQPIEGKMAVGTVVMNRVKSGIFPDTIRGVIYQKHQFSVVANGSIDNEPSAESLDVAKKIMEGSRSLKSDVLYFYNPKIATDKWITHLTVRKTIGDHVFVS